MHQHRRERFGGTVGALTAALALVAGCTSDPAPTPAIGATAGGLTAVAPTSRVTLDKVKASLTREAFVAGAWGAERGQFGLSNDENPIGPEAITVDAAGNLYVLDQVNRRAYRFGADGRLQRTIPLATGTAADLVAIGDRLLVLAHRGPGQLPRGEARHELLEIALDGDVLRRITLAAAIALPTGIFVSGDPVRPTVWVEQRHRTLTRVMADGEGLPVAQQTVTMLGRPNTFRPGDERRLLAARVGKRRATIAARSNDGALEALLDVSSERPIAEIRYLGADGQGNLFAAFNSRSEGPAPSFAISGERLRMLVRPADGSAPRTAELALSLLTEPFRPIAVGPDGTIYQLQTRSDGVQIWRWRLSQDPQQQGVTR